MPTLSVKSARRQVTSVFAFLIAAISAMGFASCRRASSADIPGTYVVKYSFGSEELTLKPNGEYTQQIRIDLGSRQINTAGTWTYDRESSEITLRDHVMAHDGYGGLKPDVGDAHNRWNAVLTVRKTLSNDVIIIASADGSGFDYRKTR